MASDAKLVLLQNNEKEGEAKKMRHQQQQQKLKKLKQKKAAASGPAAPKILLLQSGGGVAASVAKKLDPTHTMTPAELEAGGGLSPSSNKANLLNPNNPDYDPRIAEEIRALSNKIRGKSSSSSKASSVGATPSPRVVTRASGAAQL